MMEINLKSELTVFVITSDEPEFEKCLTALEDQDCEFTLSVVKGVSPMNAAFQKMLDLCETPFYIQVDADMILYPSAVRQMYEDMLNQEEKVALICYPLHDLHLGHLLMGVKIYRHSIMVKHPYVTSYSCEVDQLKRVTDAGYKWVTRWPRTSPEASFNTGFSMTDSPLVKGQHGTVWTNARIYVRYKRLMQKWRKFGYEWLESLPQRFLTRLTNEPTDINLWAFMGAVAGLVSSVDEDKERDFNEIDPAIEQLDSVLKAPLHSMGMIPTIGCKVESPIPAKIHKPVVSPDIYTHDLTLDTAPPAPIFDGPRELNVYMTTRCNLRCRFCRRQYLENASHPYEVHAGFVDEIMERFPTIKSACVAGFGEPLLAQTLNESLMALSRHKVTTGLITNGTLLTKNYAKIQDTDLAYVSVSLNAATATEYFNTTGLGLFDAALDGVRLAVRMGYRVGVSFVCTKENYHLVESYIAIARELGVAFVSLHNLLPHFSDCYSSEEFWNLVLTDQDRQELDVLEKLKEKHSDIVTSWPVPISRVSCPRKCNSPYVSIGIDGQTFHSGCRRVTGPSILNGSVREDNVWNSDHYKTLRDGLSGKAPMRDICAMCFGNWA